MATAPTAFTSDLIAALRGNMGGGGRASGIELMANPVVNYAPMPARAALPSRGGLLSPPVLTMPQAQPFATESDAMVPEGNVNPVADITNEIPADPGIDSLNYYNPSFDFEMEQVLPDEFDYSGPQTIEEDPLGPSFELPEPVSPDEFGEPVPPYEPVRPDEFGEPIPVYEPPQMIEEDPLGSSFDVPEPVPEPTYEPVRPDEFGDVLEPEIPTPDYTDDLWDPIPEPQPEISDEELNQMLMNDLMSQYFSDVGW